MCRPRGKAAKQKKGVVPRRPPASSRAGRAAGPCAGPMATGAAHLKRQKMKSVIQISVRAKVHSRGARTRCIVASHKFKFDKCPRPMASWAPTGAGPSAPHTLSSRAVASAHADAPTFSTRYVSLFVLCNSTHMLPVCVVTIRSSSPGRHSFHRRAAAGSAAPPPPTRPRRGSPSRRSPSPTPSLLQPRSGT